MALEKVYFISTSKDKQYPFYTERFDKLNEWFNQFPKKQYTIKRKYLRSSTSPDVNRKKKV